MMYRDARPLIKSGDLIAFRRSYWRSWHGIKVNLARWLTASHYSHVAIAWCVSGRVFALEAVKPVLRIHPLSDLGDFFLLPMDAQWRRATEHYALAGIGTRYSEILALKAFFGPLPDGNIEQCAAYVREILKREGINLGARSTPDAVVMAAEATGAELMFVDSARPRKTRRDFLGGRA